MLGHGGEHSKINYRALNETTDARSQQFFENQLSMRSHTKSVCSVYLVDNYIPIYLENAIDYQYFSFESAHGETMLKMGWVVKK